MRRGGDDGQLPHGEPAGDEMTVGIIAGADLRPAVLHREDFQPLGGAADEADGRAAL